MMNCVELLSDKKHSFTPVLWVASRWEDQRAKWTYLRILSGCEDELIAEWSLQFWTSSMLDAAAAVP